MNASLQPIAEWLIWHAFLGRASATLDGFALNLCPLAALPKAR